MLQVPRQRRRAQGADQEQPRHRKLRRLRHLLRGRHQGEGRAPEVPLAVSHHRRGSQDQERGVDAVSGRETLQHPKQTAHHGNPATEQHPRALGPPQLPPPRRLLLRRRLRLLVQRRRERRGRRRREEGRRGRQGDRQPAPHRAAPLPHPPPEGRGREEPSAQEGDRALHQALRRTARGLQEPPQEGHRLHQRQGRRPRPPPQHPHAAPQVLEPPLPLRRHRGPHPRPVRRPPHQQLRQAEAPRQASAQAEEGRPPRADLLADDPRPGHSRGLLPREHAQLQVLPHRRQHGRRVPRRNDRGFQRAGL
mmetsp:Transcript_19065/g.47848  ORF Transcript_19065/g.47848 Transcript_19065/m.47848 type:complete len:307 (+) Transcript_19065:243-1163(+)